MRRRTSTIGLTAAGLALLAGCGAPPTGQDPAAPTVVSVPADVAATPAPAAREATPSELLQSDRDMIRQFYPDLSDDEADAYNAASQALMQLLYIVEEEHSESFAWAITEDSEVHTAVVHFKNASPEALASVTSAGIAGVTVDNTAKYTKVEQGQLTAIPFEAVAGSGKVRSATAGYDWEQDLVTVDIAPAEGVDLATVIAGAPSEVALPGVLDAAGAPTRTPVVYVESGAVMSFG